MKKLLLTSLLILALSAGYTNLFCQNETQDAIIEAAASLHKAYLTGDFKSLMENHSFFERCLSAEPDNYLAKYYLAYTEYRLYMSTQSGSTVSVDKYYDSAVETCKNILAKEKFVSDTKTLLAGLYMMRLANNQSEAMGLAPQVMSLLEEAIQDDANNPRPLIIKGVMLLNMPPMFGRSVTGAVECFETALKLYDKNKTESLINWGYEECCAWLGQAYVRNNEVDKAREVYTKVLKAEPDFRWVKYVLLPALDKK